MEKAFEILEEIRVSYIEDVNSKKKTFEINSKKPYLSTIQDMINLKEAEARLEAVNQIIDEFKRGVYE